MEFQENKSSFSRYTLRFDCRETGAVSAAYRHQVNGMLASGNENSVSEYDTHIANWEPERPNYILTDAPELVAMIFTDYAESIDEKVDQLMQRVETAFTSSEPAPQAVLDKITAYYRLAAEAGILADFIAVQLESHSEAA